MFDTRNLAGLAGWWQWPTISWHDPRLLWGVAVLAVLMLAGAWLLARRRRGKMNRGAVICGVISVALHVLLIVLLPFAVRDGGGPAAPLAENSAGTVARVNLSTFSDPELRDQASTADVEAGQLVVPPLPSSLPIEPTVANPPPQQSPPAAASLPPLETPDSLAPNDQVVDESVSSAVDQWLTDMLAEAPAPIPAAEPTPQPVAATAAEANVPPPIETPPAADVDRPAVIDSVANVASPDHQPVQVDAANTPPQTQAPAQTQARAGRVVGEEAAEFANRRGAAQRQALIQNGGDAETEAAVQAGIAWLSNFQREDGAWDPQASGAGIERRVLGQAREGAGARATTGISGLALLALLGAGNTHQEGGHAQSARSGLQYLLSVQRPDGSLIGNADPYARTYSHGMAALAMCETAAMTGDAVAKESAASAVGYTLRIQHRTTGGWRYVPGDPGDLSQLGWQAMVLASGRAAGVDVPEESLTRTKRFLRSVRAGNTGGLASYKPGEAPSRTMTAEALAIRLLLGEQVPPAEIAEAQAYLLQELPGTGEDNFYYWYYASLALHQLQDQAWVQWNQAMKRRLLSLQQPDGSWSSATTWGGYGGKVYTTSMACLCLEVYYRHLTTDERGNDVARANSEFFRR